MTVSRVVNDRGGVGEHTRRRVRAAIEELGYRPNIVARGLKASRSATIGLLVTDLTNPYFPEIVRGAEDIAIAAGYTVFLNNVLEDSEREARALQAFEDRRTDGVILCSPRMPDDRLERLLRGHLAAVVVNRWLPTRIAGCVTVDYQHSIKQAVEHLRRCGRHRIGVLAGPELSVAGRERLRGIEQSKRELGLETAAGSVVHCPPTIAGGRSGIDELLQRYPQLDSLICFNDLVAMGAMQRLETLGLAVPEDVAVVGHDDIPFASMVTPSLTSLRVPTYELGQQAMRTLLDRMAGRPQNVGLVYQAELVARASTVGAGDGNASPPGETARKDRQ